MKITRRRARQIALESIEGPADIIDVDTGEFYASGIFEADFALWLAANPEFNIADAGWADAPEDNVFWVAERRTHARPIYSAASPGPLITRCIRIKAAPIKSPPRDARATGL